MTLLEIIVVVAVLATVTVFASPASVAGARVSSSGRGPAAWLRSSVRPASRRSRTVGPRVALESSQRSAVLEWEDVDEPLRRVELPDRRVDTAGGAQRLTFSPRGLVRDARWIVEGPGGRRLVVEVHGVTGRVSVAAPPP